MTRAARAVASGPRRSWSRRRSATSPRAVAGGGGGAAAVAAAGRILPRRRGGAGVRSARAAGGRRAARRLQRARTGRERQLRAGGRASGGFDGGNVGSGGQRAAGQQVDRDAAGAAAEERSRAARPPDAERAGAAAGRSAMRRGRTGRSTPRTAARTGRTTPTITTMTTVRLLRRRLRVPLRRGRGRGCRGRRCGGRRGRATAVLDAALHAHHRGRRRHHLLPVWIRLVRPRLQRRRRRLHHGEPARRLLAGRMMPVAASRSCRPRAKGLTAALLAGVGIGVAGCAGRMASGSMSPRTEMRCVVTLSGGDQIECEAPARSLEGDRCNCASRTGGPIYLGRVRSREVEPRPSPR